MTTRRVILSVLGVILAADIVVVLMIFIAAILMTYYGSEIVDLYLP